MEPTPSTETARTISPENGRLLVGTAVTSIEHGLKWGAPPPVVASDFPAELGVPRATFVTLRRTGALLGCIGSLEPRHALVEDVARNAYGAAFHDPRCPVLTLADLGRIDVHISILGEPEPMSFESEQDLVRQLRPGVDGLIIEEAFARGTFLPSVWESLPDPHAFLTHLKLKAGLPAAYWSDTLRVRRYTVESVP